MKIAVLPGDGIGPEIIDQALRVLDTLKADGLAIECEVGAIGGAGYDEAGDPLPDRTIALAREADAVLLGAVGGPKYDVLPRAMRPEQGLLRIRKELGLFANLRPAVVYPELASASSLKSELVEGLDLMILRELTGDIYFGQPRGRRQTESGEDEGFDTMKYSVSEIERIARVAFDIAEKRSRKLCSVDKANVLDTSILWREVVTKISAEYPSVELTGNIFGDILSDEASMLTGSIGMLPSASMDVNRKGLFEPIHGSAPDISGKNVANPLATILSVSMMLKYTFNEIEASERVESAVKSVLAQGFRTADIFQEGAQRVGTREMGDAVIRAM